MGDNTNFKITGKSAWNPPNICLLTPRINKAVCTAVALLGKLCNVGNSILINMGSINNSILFITISLPIVQDVIRFIVFSIVNANITPIHLVMSAVVEVSHCAFVLTNVSNNTSDTSSSSTISLLGLLLESSLKIYQHQHVQKYQ